MERRLRTSTLLWIAAVVVIAVVRCVLLYTRVRSDLTDVLGVTATALVMLGFGGHRMWVRRRRETGEERGGSEVGREVPDGR